MSTISNVAQLHKLTKLAKQRKYYAQNKEKWNKRVMCHVCKKEISYASMSKHRKSMKHVLISKGLMSVLKK